jgi:hypothetical protein
LLNKILNTTYGEQATEEPQRRKEKIKKIAILFLLLGMLFVPATQILNLGSVNASNAEEIYLPHVQPETVDEASRSGTVTSAISNYFATYGSYAYRQYFTSSLVTRSIMGSQANSLGYYYDFVAVLYKGHDVPWGCGNHYKLYDYTGTGVEDNYMYPNTLYGKHDFVFLWACGTTLSYWGNSGQYYCTADNAYMAIATAGATIY